MLPLHHRVKLVAIFLHLKKTSPGEINKVKSITLRALFGRLYHAVCNVPAKFKL